MTVYDNLAFGLKLRKVPKEQIDARVKEAARTIELTNLLDRKPKALSGGQRQRVALGRAIVREPAVFLMDEPLSNLDAKLRVQTRAEISRLHQRLKTTIVYVTHDQVEAMTMGTRIAVMNLGLLQQVGTPQQLYEHPANRFVAGFIGSPAMNFVHVKVEGSGDDARLKGGAFDAPIPPKLRQAVGAISDRQLVMGVRPEHLGLGERGAEVGSLRANVDVVEYLGNEELLHIRADEQYLVAVVDSNLRVRSGDVLDLVFSTEHMYLFDNETGESLTESALATPA
jgi:multiple sugar transport system ATP-binding protein